MLYLLDGQPDASTSDISEVFCRLPLPFISEEFKIDSSWKDMDSKMEQPPPYVHIRRSILLVFLCAIGKQLLYLINLEFV